MHRWIAILLVTASTFGFVGCGGSDKPKTDVEGKPVKAPEVPPDGV